MFPISSRSRHVGHKREFSLTTNSQLFGACMFALSLCRGQSPEALSLSCKLCGISVDRKSTASLHPLIYSCNAPWGQGAIKTLRSPCSKAYFMLSRPMYRCMHACTHARTYARADHFRFCDMKGAEIDEM